MDKIIHFKKMDFPPPIIVTIERVIDADTVEIDQEISGTNKVRIQGHDAPEVRRTSCQRELKLGFEAKGYARAILEGKQFPLLTKGKLDKWGRLEARFEYDGSTYAAHMVKRGYMVRATKEWWSTPPEKRWC